MLIFICQIVFAEKPKITFPSPLVRTVPSHILWCSAEGSPPINISFLRNSTFLANGIGIVTMKPDKKGIYTCLARNEAGSDSKQFLVEFIRRSPFFSVRKMYSYLLLPLIHKMPHGAVFCVVVRCGVVRFRRMQCGVLLYTGGAMWYVCSARNTYAQWGGGRSAVWCVVLW